MPVIKDLMLKLAKEYGEKKGKEIYYAMENSGKLEKAKKTVEARRKS